MSPEKKIVFGLAGKIFNYTNRINSVRIVLAVYLCKYDDLDLE